MNPLDIAALAVILICAIGCAVRGIVREVFGLASFFVGGMAAFILWKPLSRVLPLPDAWAWASVAISCALLFIAAFLLVKLVERGLHDGLEAMRMGALDHGLGFLLGVFEGLLVAGILAGLLAAQPLFDVTELLSGSFFWKIIGPAADLRRYLGDVR